MLKRLIVIPIIVLLFPLSWSFANVQITAEGQKKSLYVIRTALEQPYKRGAFAWMLFIHVIFLKTYVVAFNVVQNILVS